MNLLDVKNVVNQIILMLETMIEDQGQDGDFDIIPGLQQEREMFLTASSELNELNNTDIAPYFLSKVLSENVPSLNLALFEENIRILTSRKKHTVERLTAEIDSFTMLAEVFSSN